MSADEPAPSPPLHLHLLGVPHWRGAEGGEAHDAGTRHPLAPRDAALLALLAVDGHVARDRVAAWLWPEAESQARANLSLRQRLFRLRRECGHPLVEAGLTLSLADGVLVDLHAQPLPTEGLLLAGLDFGAFEAFEQWLAAARDTLGRRQADTLSGQAARLEEAGALAEAIACTEGVVARWPATEHAWRRLMRLHWRRADRAAAIASFERFEQQVCREWGLRPSQETLALLATIEQADAHAATAAPPGAGLPPGLLHPPALVGREAALQALARAWDEGRATLLLAPGGMGKSRLLDAFLAGRAGVLRLRGRPGDATRPYATLAQALDDALTRFAPVLPPATRDELARLVPRLGPAPSGPAQPARLFAAVAQVWRAAADAGLRVLAWDDLHWADAATLELLHALLAEPTLAPLQQVFAARPSEGTPADQALPAWLGDSLRVQPLKLAPWSLADLQALLPTLGLPHALAADAGLPERLLRQTGGQPFFVLETLKTLVLAHAAGAAPAAAPAVEAMLERRIARLAEPARRLLQLLAVAAGALPLATAAQVLQRPLVDLAADWQALADAQLVHDDGLAHDLVRAAVLGGLPKPARQALHLALARALAVQPQADAARLAPLWQAAGAWPEAAAAWQQAAAMAVRTGRLVEATSLFDQALAAAESSGDTALRVAVHAAAQPTRLLREGPEAVALRLQPLLAEVHAPAPRARLLLLLADAELSRMRAPAADAAAAEALALCDDTAGLPALPAEGADTDPTLLDDATLMRGRTLAWTGQPDAGITLLHAACERADADGDLRRRLRAQDALADVLTAAGRRMDSCRAQQQLLALARRLGDRFEIALAASNHAVYALLVGDAAAAWQSSSQALQAFDAMGVEHVNRLMCASVHTIAAAHHGRFDMALATALPLLAGADGADPLRRNLRNVLANVHIWLGCPEAAAGLLPPLDDEAPPLVRVTGLFTRLRWCAAAGVDDSAERAALQALGEAVPALRDDAHFYRIWAHYDAPGEALPRLDRMAENEAAAGATGLATGLGLAALQIAAREAAPDALERARRLAPLLPEGLHPALLPSEAWWCLAQALMAGDTADRMLARHALQQARAWIDAARLPDELATRQQHFREHHPLHAAVMSARLPA
jgi:DNA-binding SARP family transcriptional activator